MGQLKEIKSIPVIPFALITGAIAAVLAFIWSVLISLFGASLLTLIPIQETGAALVGGFIGAIILIVGFTIGAFIVGFIMYAIVALIYNFLASKLGGIQIELE